MDLLDLWRGALSWRRLRVLIDMLPPASAYWRARHGAGDWTVTEYMLADLFDVSAAANWQRAGDPKARKPKAYPRPGVQEAKESAIERAARAMQARNKSRGR